MKTKKNPKADLEKMRTLFFQFGLLFTLSALLLAFNWKSQDKSAEALLLTSGTEIVDVQIPVTIQEKTDVLPPPPPRPTIEFELVGDETEIEDPPIFIPTDTDQDERMIDYGDFGEDKEKHEPDPILYNLKIKPKFKSDEYASFQEYILDNIEFPEVAKQNGVSGAVYFQFVVEKDGSLSQIKVTRGVDEALNDEVLRVIHQSPKWEPGLQNGHLVRAFYSMRVKFVLQ